jgi:hypothetical protein
VAGEKDEFRVAIGGYLRAYSFLFEVVDFGDVGLEALYLAGRALVTLRPIEGGGRLDLGAQVEWRWLRLRSSCGPHGVGPSARSVSRGPPMDSERGSVPPSVHRALASSGRSAHGRRFGPPLCGSSVSTTLRWSK